MRQRIAEWIRRNNLTAFEMAGFTFIVLLGGVLIGLLVGGLVYAALWNRDPIAIGILVAMVIVARFAVHVWRDSQRDDDPSVRQVEDYSERFKRGKR